MSSTEVTQKYFTLPDGAKLAYDVFGEEHLNKRETLPIILIGGVSSTKVDWDRLIPHVSKKRTVLIFDHRGIGSSTYSTPANDDKLTIESLSRDIVALIESFGWKDVDILGLSMGGLLLQQMLLLHRHPTNPTVLPFHVHHAILTATFASSIPPEYIPKPLPKIAATPGQPLTKEQKKELARPLLETSLGPKWVAATENQERFNFWWENSIVNREATQIGGLMNFSFVEELKQIDPRTDILVIHGIEDAVVPFSSAEEILRACPQARLVSLGSKRGQVPTYAFGHIWYEYFEIGVWMGVLESFLDNEYESVGARL
ncbi:hypothetical protein Clacol_005121 [Clathrus columnatus]|uniref:AB hydrolase-1 domain-containing protein n=1 Tax=Clathrus columnatus TaxID=1419009 RepID=A0AAV5ABN7_9AGAM|nr:hypothetical protein Clacol_005121 [Clathrus columnatus]